MFLNENRIVEKICEFPTTLGDISENIFGGISSKNSLLHRLVVPEGSGSESLYLCEGLCKPVILESELIYPYVSGSFPEKFALNSSPYRFMLPYELSEKDNRKECRIIPPEELRVRFPLTYGRILEFKNQFGHDDSPVEPADYSIRGRKLLEYLNTPKIIATEGYRLQAAYDVSGNHVFKDGCGIVLKDPEKYPYVTAVLNSQISRLFPSVCEYEMIYSSSTTPAVMKRFPIVFPEDRLTEDLINSISGYLMFLSQQKYEAGYSAPDWLNELAGFYEQISDLLVVDAYFENGIDPRLLGALEENIHPYAGDMESESDESLLSVLHYIRQKIMESSNFNKYTFNKEFSGILSFL
ncbi:MULTISPECIES: hypothetical protein [Methanosarcina]|jgi:hypothetical protein|uniref:Uncharacterized protein n=5 Tax=Methanosarcina mazei TaxID=2209 RepID=A0A0F8LMZ3_METMZ|nr:MULTISPECIES: hypothetical protein [Methanosarcina]AGF97338.1 hypothetical protein MmTuc01_2005 [Methanosarcina mazei Tuc01]AKB41692.1 hypothetical protein MSMAW_2701 [Methanosarcina mazei WWM610]AKB68914.1 hypothetical protein MSMAL_2371 [Methanosarcina mazei LYC]AKB71559.1 hypothetical protein MSMAC_1669 [Methanosarcina mazei C16]KKG02547.1 hypothetical protein DU40_09810 [Methanosarcina mazei]